MTPLREALEWFERVDGGWTDEFRDWAYTTFAGMDFDLLEDGALLIAYGANGRVRGLAKKQSSHQETLRRLRALMDRLSAPS